MSSASLVIDQGDRKLRSAFFQSVTLLVSVAAIILAGAEESLFPSGVTPIIAVFSWIVVDHYRWLRVPIWIGNVLALTALGFAVREFNNGEVLEKLFAGAHLIVYLTWVILLMPKGHRQFWWLIALTLLHLAIAGVLSTGAGFGASLIGMMLLLLWTMSVFSLFRVQDRHAGQLRTEQTVTRRADPGAPGLAAPITVRNGLQRDASEAWIGWRLRGMVLASCLVSLVLAGFVFAAFPRVWVPGGSLLGSARAATRGAFGLTGARDSIELGHIGQMMLSNQRVLSFSITDIANGKPVTVETFEDAMLMDEIRFRGNAHGIYRDGRWARGSPESGRPNDDVSTSEFGKAAEYEAAFLVDVSLDPPFTGLAYAPTPVARAVSKSGFAIHQRTQSGALIWMPFPEGVQSAPLNYHVECPRLDRTPEATFEYWTIRKDVPEQTRQRMQNGNRAFAANRFITGGLARRLPQLAETAIALCSDNGRFIPEAQRADRVLRHLSGDNGFQYSLKLGRSNRQLDPIEDFLLNTKSGHCEYFASACALMLQSVEVPARVVSGFYGCEKNSLTGRYEVRARHAHAWVEAWIDDRWQTLEPTPASERRAGVNSQSQTTLLSDMQLAFTDLWNNGVSRMSAERQQEFFAPVIASMRALWNSIRQQGLLTLMKDFFSSFVKSPEVWFSWQGGVMTFVLGLFVFAAVRHKLWMRLRQLLDAMRLRYSSQHRTAQSVIRFYASFCSLCERHGLQFPESGSAFENSESALKVFGSRWSSPELRAIPRRIAAAFNEVRFGGSTLTEESAVSLGRELQLLTEALRAPT